MGTERVMTVVGTRPEIIRLSRTLPRLDDAFHHVLVHTGQNYDHQLSQVFFDELGLRSPDRCLKVDTSSLARVLAETLIGVEEAILEVRPRALVVLGDTNSCIAAIIAKRLQVPVYHLEAGNRCFDENVPEEVNRRLVDHVADFNLVYTEHARRNLLAEGLPSRRIALTGSPMREVLDHYGPQINASDVLTRVSLDADGFVLVSLHREENVDEPHRLARLIQILEIVGREMHRPLLVSTHPRTRKRLQDAGLECSPSVLFHEPFGFLDYVYLEQRAHCILSDSGTIGEEAALLGLPAVSLRPAIERPEALEAGAVLTTSFEPESVMAALEQAVKHRDRAEPVGVPAEYRISDFSRRVVDFVRSTMDVHHEWSGIRRRSPVWSDSGPAG